MVVSIIIFVLLLVAVLATLFLINDKNLYKRDAVKLLAWACYLAFGWVVINAMLVGYLVIAKLMVILFEKEMPENELAYWNIGIGIGCLLLVILLMYLAKKIGRYVHGKIINMNAKSNSGLIKK